MNVLRPAAPLALLAALTACATGNVVVRESDRSLTATIDRIRATPPFDHAIWGIDVEDDTGRTLYAQNAHLLMVPASNRKLFSTATVLDCLGGDARLETQFLRDGDDLVVRGGGDPSLGTDSDFRDVADALRSGGVVSVRDLVADVSRFDRETIPESWKVGNLTSDYAAPIDALSYAENAVGDRAVTNGPMFALEHLRDALVLAGVKITGSLQVVTTPRCGAGTDCRLVARMNSPFVADLVATLLHYSDNFYAEVLLKDVAADGSYAGATDLERRFLIAECGIDPAEFHFVDGSGLSPDDLVTPFAIVRMLRWMDQPVRRGLWWALLPQPQAEGTLHRRLPGLQSRLRAKTGTINGVNALSGFVVSRDGHHRRYFSIIVDHHLDAVTNPVLDAIAGAIAEF